MAAPLLLTTAHHSFGQPRRIARCGLLALATLALLADAPAQAQPTPTREHERMAAPMPRPLPPDRDPRAVRRADAARLRELAAQREFRYVEPDASTDAWDAFWARLWRWLGDLMSTRTGRFTWKYGLYTIMLAALVFAVVKLLKVDITGAFGRSARRGPLAYDTATENIHEVDFSARIAEAEATGNFRLATRLGYLEVLKQLTDRSLIDWQPDKTNHAYLGELAAGPVREAFRGATREFEYVWYGELRLTAGLYQQARQHQRAVAAHLTGSRTAAHSSAA